MRSYSVQGIHCWIISITLGIYCPSLPTHKALGAPAPRPRPIAIPLDVEGTWRMTWGPIVYNMTLDCGKTPGAQGGAYCCIEAPKPPEDTTNTLWVGSWTYDPGKGVLRIHETTDGGDHWDYWEARIDGRGWGEAVYGAKEEHRVPIGMRMERCRKVPTYQ